MKNNALKSFFDELSKFKNEFAQVEQKSHSLREAKAKLQQKIVDANQLNATSLNQNSDLAKNISQLQTSIQTNFEQWEIAVNNAEKMQALSAAFENRIIFLIFGKVNAGKSSFTNQIVAMYKELFPQDRIRHFYFENGKVADLNTDHFAEGFTETTAQIQGVELGDYFVLLDSPGLHSVTDENGDLTRQFIDSADAVLWLSPSTSPGQVQELQDLKAELEKGKPLQPVITRSDEFEEDWDDDKGDFVNVLKNKTPENRTLQESDVFNRLKTFEFVSEKGKKELKLDLSKVKSPISISVYCYKEQSDAQASGLGRLFDSMSELIDQARDYKVNKAEKQLQNFLQEKVISGLNSNLLPEISKLKIQAEEAVDTVKTKKSQIQNNVLTYLSGRAFHIVNKYKDSRDKNAIADAVSLELTKKLNEELVKELTQFINGINEIHASLNKDQLANFEDRKVEYEVIKGTASNRLAAGVGTAAGGAAGAALGTMILPGVGTVVGGVVGSLFGGWGGSKIVREETEWVTETVGVSVEKLEKSLQQQLQDQVPALVENSINEVLNQLQPLHQVCQKLEQEINGFITEVTQ